jgi:hypothetical protein
MSEEDRGVMLQLFRIYAKKWEKCPLNNNFRYRLDHSRLPIDFVSITLTIIQLQMFAILTASIPASRWSSGVILHNFEVPTLRHPLGMFV